MTKDTKADRESWETKLDELLIRGNDSYDPFEVHKFISNLLASQEQRIAEIERLRQEEALEKQREEIINEVEKFKIQNMKQNDKIWTSNDNFIGKDVSDFWDKSLSHIIAHLKSKSQLQ